MADTKISDLAAVTDVLATDEYVLARSGATKKIDASNLLVASEVAFTPTGTVASTDVQAAIVEVATEAATSGTATLSTTTLGSDTATFDITSISGSYNHLRLMMMSRTTTASGNILMAFNNDTGANYDFELAVYNNSSSVAEGVAQTGIRIGSVSGTGAATNVFTYTILDIPFYSAGMHKGCTYLQQLELAASSTNVFTVTGSGLWHSTSVINRITLALSSGSFKTGSRLIIYGVP